MKKPWVAAVLSLFCSGLGHLYVGRPVRALVFLLVPLAITAAMVAAVVLPPSGLALALFLLLALGTPIFWLYVVIDAYRLARLAPVDAAPHWWQHPLVYACVIVIGLGYPFLSAGFLRAEVLEAFKIPTMSMAPTIVRGDRILVRKWAWGSEDVERGDLVVFVAPEGPPRNFVKRVTGLPGDRVHLRDGTPQRVPEHHLWMRGDNVESARDSRHFGAVPFENLVGLVTYRYWPPSRIGTLPVSPGAVQDLEREPPDLRAARLAANETAAIATLRNLIAAQAHFQQVGKADQDGDGVGEYGGFLELSGAASGRMGTPLMPPVLSSVFQQLSEDGEFERSGYVYRVFLPGPMDADGKAPGVPEPVPGGYVDDGGMTVDADLAETAWCCYAWPAEHGRSGVRTFFTNQTETIFGCTVEAYSGMGQGPAADAAFAGEGSITGRVVEGGPGRNPNGEIWRQVD